MRAAIVEKYGPPEVVVLKEVPSAEPKDNEVLVRVRATCVNSGDARVRGLRVPAGFKLPMLFALGFSGPKQKILGLEAAGVVERVGKLVTRFKPGDRVLASSAFDFGCHAELVSVAESGAIVAIPDGLSFEDAASLCFGGVTTLDFFRRGNVAGGESILINGASGAVGTMAVQIAKSMGMTVTAVCSGKNAELVRSLGADEVIDYTREELAETAARFDFIMDNHGNAPFRRVKHLLKPGGKFMMVIGNLWEMLTAVGNKQVVSSGDNKQAINADAYRRLMALAERGALQPVIDSRFPFERIVEAHRRVDGGHKVGSVVVSIP